MSLSRPFPSSFAFMIAAAIGCFVVACGSDSSDAQEDSSDSAAATAEDEPRAEDTDDQANDGENGDKEEKLQTLELADGRLLLEMPARWEKQQPRSRITELELAVPAKKEDGDDETDEGAEAGRLTVTAAGGSIEANIDRWIGQFKQPDGKPSHEVAKIEEKEYDELKVHLFDLAGTFLDRRGGPFNPNAQVVELKNHRMLAAIIETEGAGYYFIKFTGPQKTVEQSETAFWRALEGLEWK